MTISEIQTKIYNKNSDNDVHNSYAALKILYKNLPAKLVEDLYLKDLIYIHSELLHCYPDTKQFFENN